MPSWPSASRDFRRAAARLGRVATARRSLVSPSLQQRYCRACLWPSFVLLACGPAPSQRLCRRAVQAPLEADAGVHVQMNVPQRADRRHRAAPRRARRSEGAGRDLRLSLTQWRCLRRCANRYRRARSLDGWRCRGLTRSFGAAASALSGLRGCAWPALLRGNLPHLPRNADPWLLEAPQCRAGTREARLSEEAIQASHHGEDMMLPFNPS